MAERPSPTQASLAAVERVEQLEREVAALKQALAESHELIGVAPAFFGFTSLDGVVLGLNDLALKVIERTREDIVGTIFWEAPWWKPIPSSAARIRAAVADGRDGKSSQFDLPYMASVGGVGQPRWVSISVTPHCDEAGTVRKLAISGIDITEQVEARRRIEESALLLEAISTATPDFIFAKNRDSRILFANPAVFKILGRAPEEVVGHTDAEFLGEELGRPILENDRRIMESGEAEQVEEHIVSEGVPRIYVSNKMPFRQGDGEIIGLLGMSRDVTELRAAQRELSVNVKKLEEERELRERFVLTITHDLRSPLNAASMATAILAMNEHPPQTVDLIGKIKRNIARMDKMISDLLDANLIQAGGTLFLQPKPVDLVALAKEIFEDLGGARRHRFELLAATPIHGVWDESGIRRLLENCLKNADKYGAPDRPVTLRLSLVDGARVKMVVHNWGNPIPAVEVATLFTPFHRVAPAKAVTRKQGWGIGLTVVQGMTVAHGGNVNVESTEEKGTTFTIVLPLDSTPLIAVQ